MLWVTRVVALVAGALLFMVGQQLPEERAVSRSLRIGGGLLVVLGVVLLFLGNTLPQG